MDADERAEYKLTFMAVLQKTGRHMTIKQIAQETKSSEFKLGKAAKYLYAEGKVWYDRNLKTYWVREA